MLLLAWAAGGVLSIIGALCYAELAAIEASAGGDYHYLMRAFGQRLAFLYAWARLSVIQTGSIALLAFIFGDYATQILSLGPLSSATYGALVIQVITTLTWIVVPSRARAQNSLPPLEEMCRFLV